MNSDVMVSKEAAMVAILEGCPSDGSDYEHATRRAWDQVRLLPALNAQAPVARTVNHFMCFGCGYGWSEEVIDPVCPSCNPRKPAPPSTAALQARVERLEEAVKAYQRAGFGNSTDFRLQAEASELARAALASEVRS